MFLLLCGWGKEREWGEHPSPKGGKFQGAQSTSFRSSVAICKPTGGSVPLSKVAPPKTSPLFHFSCAGSCAALPFSVQPGELFVCKRPSVPVLPFLYLRAPDQNTIQISYAHSIRAAPSLRFCRARLLPFLSFPSSSDNCNQSRPLAGAGTKLVRGGKWERRDRCTTQPHWIGKKPR